MVMRNTSGFAAELDGEDCAHIDVASVAAIRRKRARKALNDFIRGQRITTNVGYFNSPQRRKVTVEGVYVCSSVSLGVYVAVVNQPHAPEPASMR
jgi:hypothetical protein